LYKMHNSFMLVARWRVIGAWPRVLTTNHREGEADTELDVSNSE